MPRLTGPAGHVSRVRATPTEATSERSDAARRRGRLADGEPADAESGDRRARRRDPPSRRRAGERRPATTRAAAARHAGCLRRQPGPAHRRRAHRHADRCRPRRRRHRTPTPPRRPVRVSTTKTARPRPGTPHEVGRLGGTSRTASAKALKDEARGDPGRRRHRRHPGAALAALGRRPPCWPPAPSPWPSCSRSRATGCGGPSPRCRPDRDQVLAAAKQCTALTNTYTYTTIAADEKRARPAPRAPRPSATSPPWRTSSSRRRRSCKASQTVQINTAGIESVTSSGAQWTVVIFGQTTIRQTGASARVDPFSTVVRMDHAHGKWLISSICLITAPNGSQAASC